MNKTNINYPHPVLSALNEDYINSKFDIELIDEPMVEGDKAIITVGYDLECTGLEELVKQGKAKVVIYLESVVAEYRHIEAFPAETDVLEIIINKENIIKTEMKNKKDTMKMEINKEKQMIIKMKELKNKIEINKLKKLKELKEKKIKKINKMKFKTQENKMKKER